MTKRLWKICGVLTVIFLLTGLYDFRLATGFALGIGAAALLYCRNNSYWNDVVDAGTVPKGTGILHFVLNYGIMAGVLILAALLPQYLNIFTCAAGLMMIKWAAFLDYFLPHRESKQ